MEEAEIRELASRPRDQGEIKRAEVLEALESLKIILKCETGSDVVIDEHCEKCLFKMADIRHHRPNQPCTATTKMDARQHIRELVERVDKGLNLLDAWRGGRHPDRKTQAHLEEQKEEMKRREQEMGELRRTVIQQRESENVATNQLLNLLGAVVKDMAERGKGAVGQKVKREVQKATKTLQGDWGKGRIGKEAMERLKNLVDESGASTNETGDASSEWSPPSASSSIRRRREGGLELNEENIQRLSEGVTDWMTLETDESMDDEGGAVGGAAANEPDQLKPPSSEQKDTRKVVRISSVTEEIGKASTSASWRGRANESDSSSSDNSSGSDRRRAWKREKKADRDRRHRSKGNKQKRSSDDTDSTLVNDSDDERRRRKRKKRQEREIGRRKHPHSSDEIVPITATVEKDKVKVFPGLDDPDPDVELKHQTMGRVCGGVANQKNVKELVKFAEAVDFEKKDKGETEFVSWMRREREFWEVMENVTTVETPIYDIVAAFSQKLLPWKNHLRPLKKKVSYYRSFRHFLQEFRVARWPGEREAGLMEVDQLQQRPKEQIDAYYERYTEVTALIDWPETCRVDWFMSGLRDERVREKVMLHDFEEKTMENVKDLAIKHWRKLEVSAALSQRRKVYGSEAAHTGRISSVVVRGRGGGVRGARGVRGGIRGARSFRGAMSGSRNHASVASTGATYGNAGYEAGRETWSRNQALRQMRVLKVKGCAGCLQSHYFKPGFETCASFCPFCNVEFRQGQPRHFAMFCHSRPRNSKDMFAAIERAKARASRSK